MMHLQNATAARFPVFIAYEICENSEPTFPWQGLPALTTNRSGASIMADEHVARRVWVYKITCSVNGKQYFGITKTTVPKRWMGHKTDAFRPNRGVGALGRAIRKYGPEAFVIEEVCVAFGVENACAIEREMIAEYGTLTPHGYNLTSGGEAGGGHKHSAESVERNRQRNLGKTMAPEVRAKISAALKGRPKTPGHIENARVGCIGRSVTEETKEKLRRIRHAQLADPVLQAKMYAALLAAGDRISEGRKKAWALPGAKDRVSGKEMPWLKTPEARKNAAAAHAEKWQDPEYKAWMIERRNASPKVQACRERMRSMNKQHGRLIKTSMEEV